MMVNRNQKSFDKNGKQIEVKNVASVTDSDEIVYDGQKYRLQYVIVHLGRTTQSGHYVTYNVKNMSVFNDSPKPTIKPVAKDLMDVAKATGYIYGYKIMERLVVNYMSYAMRSALSYSESPRVQLML